ncbi:TPA: tRNA (guanosine(37)-N1)-methyltransferase TrmD [Candidatus Gastranaerophilales bacterium HUM_9]|nr:MAG TPA: tRNA (guanosine(37)-N1)-methyltransferase TrmD [Candidatus Gastranaerophilales bacterium HUM_9]HBX35665.1 tRNA (guanosine(37)-N1)-methyltransferase TrmD [Cyanobacteria bacterium UBA11440]
MKFDILTLFPEMIEQACSHSIMKRAVDSGVLKINTINPRDFTLDKHNKVDDTPYGGGAGMVLMAQPYVDAYESIERAENTITLMMTPQGERFDNKMCTELAKYDQIVILCGHYEGFDERIRTIIQPKEVSIGDFVLTGGELPALCLMDSVSRKLDGTLGKIESMEEDSFENGLLEYPQYTKPREYRGLNVPEVLLNGNHALINEFRYNEQLKRTKERRPDLYEKYVSNHNPSTKNNTTK